MWMKHPSEKNKLHTADTQNPTSLLSVLGEGWREKQRDDVRAQKEMIKKEKRAGWWFIQWSESLRPI